MATNKASVLKDVVAYVDVWSSDKTENFSEPFILKLEEMGAQVKKRFSKHVTHVIFSYGHPATWRNAKKDNVKLVSVLWVNRCYEEAERVNEDLFPALSETNPALLNKKHRCMQPKDSPERTPNSDKRMKKKLDKMMKNVTPSMPLFKEFSPIVIDEESGIIYSPAFKRSEYMARRLKERKEENENISHSESQMESPSDQKPSLGNSPTVFKFPYNQSDDEAGPSVAETGSAAESPAKEAGTSLPDIKQHRHEQETTEQLCVSSWSHGSPEKISVEHSNVEGKKDEENLLSSRRSSRRISLKHMVSIKANLFTTTPDTPGTSDSKKSNKVGRRSSIKSTSSSKGKKPLSSECTSKKGQGMTKTNKSSKETKTLLPENVNYATDLFTTAISTLSLKTTSPEGNMNSKRTSFCSALVQPDKLSCESLKNVPCTADGDDDVFEDYFSPANLSINKKKACSIAKTEQFVTTNFPFELDSGSTKVKPRRSDSAVNDINMSKKKQSKLHFKDPHAGNASEKLTDLAVSAEHFKPLAKKRRCSALPFTSMSAPSTTQRKQPPQTVKTTKSQDTDAALESHEKPDCSLRSDSVTRNEDKLASELTRTECTSLQMMAPTTRVERTLVMTSMPTDKQSMVVQVVKALGQFTLVDEVCASTTHVVSVGHRRTLNILLGIARGCWILSYEWILWSLEKRHWIPEEPYELSDQFPAAQICRLQRHLSAGEHQQDLFQDQPTMYVSQLSQPPPQSLVQLIELCGGAVSRSVRQAGLCIGKYSGRRPEGSRVLSEKWVLDCITHLKLLPYDGYILD